MQPPSPFIYQLISLSPLTTGVFIHNGTLPSSLITITVYDLVIQNRSPVTQVSNGLDTDYATVSPFSRQLSH